MADKLTRFLIENLDIRGAIVQLDSSWTALCHGRDYPVPVQTILGQMCAVTTIIAANLKQAGRLTFQLSGHGPVSMLVVDCPENLNLRGYARHSQISAEMLALPDLLADGQLLMSLDTADARQPYQSYVPVQGQNVSEIFSHYLTQSEQQPSWLFLAANQTQAVGLFLQKLPGADLLDPDGWNRIEHLASTVQESELFKLDAQTLLTRLFSEETVRVFAPRTPIHHYPPDREKIATMLRGLGQDEVESILAEQGEILIHDELSNHEYRFSPSEARALFGPDSPTLH